MGSSGIENVCISEPVQLKEHTGFQILLFVLFSGLALLAALLTASNVRKIDPDVMQYVGAARQIAKGEGATTTILYPAFVPRLPAPFVIWPPLYPAVIAGVSKFGMDAGVAARWVSLFAFALSDGMLWEIGSTFFETIDGAIAVLLIVMWPPARTNAAYGLSESLFTLFFLTSVLMSAKSLSYSQRRRDLAMALGGLAMGAAALTRFMGAALIPIGFVSLLIASLSDKREPARKKITGFLLWILFASFAPMAWCLRNWILTGHLRGIDSQADSLGWAFHATSILGGIVSDFLPFLAATHLRLRFQLLDFGIIGALVVVLAQKSGFRSDNAIRAAMKALGGSPQRRLVSFMTIGYLIALLIVRSSLGVADPIGTRYLMPSYPLLLLLAVACAVAFLGAILPGLTTMLIVGTAAAFLVTMTSLFSTLNGAGLRLTPPPAPEWVRWVAANATSDTLIIGNLAHEYNFYLDRPVLAFSSHPFCPYSHFNCQKISRILVGLGQPHAYLILKELDTSDMSRYGEAIDQILKGKTPLPLRLLHRSSTFAAYEVLDSRWQCN